MSRMTLYDFIVALESQVRYIDDAAQIALEAASNTTHSFYVSRIFERGLDNELNPIGTYSTRKTNFFRWNFLPKNYNKFKPSGYFSEKGRTLAYMTLNGYKQLKAIQGLRSDTVNFTYTGALKRNFSQMPKKANAYKGNKRRAVVIDNSTISNPSWDTPKIPKGKTNTNKVIKLTQQYRSMFIKHSSQEKHMFASHFNRRFIQLNFQKTKWELTTSDLR
jgi:hypothetical protein